MLPSAPLRLALLAPLWHRIPPATGTGVELFLKLLVDELVARGHEVTLFATRDCHTAATLQPVAETQLVDELSPSEAGRYTYFANRMLAEVLGRSGEFDVLHCCLPPAWIPLGALAPVPVVWTLYRNLSKDDEVALAASPTVQAVGISQAQVRTANLALGRQLPHIYPGLDLAEYTPSEEPGEYLAFLGRLGPLGNAARAIALAELAKMPLVISGAPLGAEEQAYFDREVKPRIDGKKVRWLGAVSHLQKVEFLRRAAALVVPTAWDDPFGVPMVEAMACGTPALAHRRGAVAEMLDEGVTGYHVGVLDAMADALTPTLELDRAAVRAQAERRFGFHRMVDEYEALYRAAL